MSRAERALLPILDITGCYGSKTAIDGLLLYGQVWQGDSVLSIEQLKIVLDDALKAERLAETVADFNGFFSVVWQYGGYLRCFTDKVRSRPLFYAVSKQQLIISDQAALICRKYLEPADIKPLVQQEFIHTGFVTGAETLHPDVKQLQAAELLEVNLTSGAVCRQMYYCFIPGNTVEPAADVADWQRRVDIVTKRVVNRLVHYAAGRQIVLPLSGGYDSRALALYLKLSGYSNVLCFTFGRAGSAEVLLSKRVAKELGFTWHNVQYSRQLWRDLLTQDSFSEYLDFVHGLVSVPNIQVYPAIAQLVAQKVIETDAVIAPGHTSAFFSGDLANSGAPAEPAWPEQALQAILARHYQNSRQPLDEDIVNKVRQQVSEIVDYAARQGVTNINSVAEAWNYRERQAKFIINSNRYYDNFQLDWWMPFWDSEFMAFWQQVPYNLRRKKILWTGFVESMMTNYTGSKLPYGHASVKKYSWLTRGYSWFNYFLDDNYLYTLVPFRRWLLFKLRLTKRSGTVFGCLAERSVEKYKLQSLSKKNV